MEELTWVPTYNEFTRSQSLESRSSRLIYRISKESSGVLMSVSDSYTGEFLRNFNVLDIDVAQRKASEIEKNLFASKDLRTVLKWFD